MKRILSEVSVADMRGPLNKLTELLSNEKFGHYWRYQLILMMRKEPTHVLTKKWLEDLSSKYTWEKAEKHFLNTKQLWFNEPEWPFQICVLEIGGMDNSTLHKKWKRLYPDYNDLEGSIDQDIKHLPQLSLVQKKIFLIRLQARFFDLPEEFEFRKINCPHPSLNLSFCPPETAFFMRFLVREYYDLQPTVIAMDFHPADLVDKNKKRVYYFFKANGYGNYICFGGWDILLKDSTALGLKNWWIFQYNLPKE